MSELVKEEILHQTSGYNVSDKYNVIPSIDVIQRMEKYGFELKSVEAAGTRSIEKALKQKHLVRMKAPYELAPGLVPEVAIFNSYDGTQALRISIAVMRMVCQNGLIIGENLVPEFKITHLNTRWEDELDSFIDTYETKYNKTKEFIGALEDRKMSLDEAYNYAERALEIRHYDKRISNDAIDPLELLIAHRVEDRGDSAWIRYNNIQYAMINGTYHKLDYDGSIRKAKRLTDVSEIFRVNRDLSDMFVEAI